MGDERKRFGAHLARLRIEAGMSQRELAEELCRLSGVGTLTRSEVSRYERGERIPDTWLPFIAEALGACLDDLKRAAFPARWANRMEEHAPAPTVADFLPEDDPLAPLGSRSGRRIGEGTVDDLTRRVHGLRLADDVIAGGDLLHPAVRELKSAIKLYRDGTFTDEVGRQLLVTIGELAQIAGWVASDAGEHAQAERIYRIGLSAAHSAGDATLAGNILGTLAYQVSNVGDPREGVAMARAAIEQANGVAPPRARALYWDRVAWAHVRAKEAQPAMRALSEASEALSQCSSADEDPAYLYWVDAGELKIMEARAYTELHRPLRAVPLLTDVLSRYDATHARELALYLSWLAVAYTDANEPEEAAGTTARMLALSADVASERTVERSRVVLRRLQQFQDVPEVRSLLADHRNV